MVTGQPLAPKTDPFKKVYIDTIIRNPKKVGFSGRRKGLRSLLQGFWWLSKLWSRLLGTLHHRCRIILEIQKGTIILTITHMGSCQN